MVFRVARAGKGFGLFTWPWFAQTMLGWRRCRGGACSARLHLDYVGEGTLGKAGAGHRNPAQAYAVRAFQRGGQTQGLLLLETFPVAGSPVTFPPNPFPRATQSEFSLDPFRVYPAPMYKVFGVFKGAFFQKGPFNRRRHVLPFFVSLKKQSASSVPGRSGCRASPGG